MPNLAITHCKSGHEFTESNTIIRKNGTRKCRECSIRGQKEFKQRKVAESGNTYFREKNLKAFYRMTIEQYEELLRSQNGRCANHTCDATPEVLHVDHDHSCCSGRQTCGKCVRGLLCNKCNLILGLVGDSSDILLGLARYLDKSWNK